MACWIETAALASIAFGFGYLFCAYRIARAFTR